MLEVILGAECVIVVFPDHTIYFFSVESEKGTHVEPVGGGKDRMVWVAQVVRAPD